MLAATFDEDGGVTLDEHGIGVFVLIEGDAVVKYRVVVCEASVSTVISSVVS